MAHRSLSVVIVIFLGANLASAQGTNKQISLDSAKLCVLQLLEYSQTYDILLEIEAPLPKEAFDQGVELTFATMEKIGRYPRQGELEAYTDRIIMSSEDQYEVKKSIYEGMIMGAPDKRAMTGIILESVMEPLKNCDD